MGHKIFNAIAYWNGACREPLESHLPTDTQIINYGKRGNKIVVLELNSLSHWREVLHWNFDFKFSCGNC